MFWGCWPSTLLSILCFLSFAKTLFFPWKQVVLFISQCLPFFLLGFFHFSFFTLCLSCFLFFCLFLAFLLISPSLFFCCSFLPCFLAFVSRKKLHLKGFFSSIISVFGVSCFALPFKSLFLILFLSFFQLCVLVNINVFIVQRRTFLKHSALFCALRKVTVFAKGRFWGQIRLMFEKHCKNRHLSTGLRALQIQFSRVEGLGLRLLCGPGESVRVQAPKQNIKNKHFRYWGFLWFDHVFGHWCRTIEVINVKR